MFVWLIVLFSSMATAAGDFLSVHLAIIVRILNINESLAGITIFAFGNGSTDLFSTLAAMNSDNAGLAISELFGAAAFIVTVVLGFVAIAQPFQVNPNTFVGDVVWFIVAASMLVAFLADGRLIIGECLGIVGLYVTFVCFALLRLRDTESSTISVTTIESSQQDANHQCCGESIETHPGARPEASSTFEATTRPATEHLRALAPDTSSHADAEDSISEHDENQPLLENNEEISNESNLLSDRSDWHSIFTAFPPLLTWSKQNWAERFLTISSLPLLIPMGLTVPVTKSGDDECLADGVAAVQDSHSSESTLGSVLASSPRPRSQRPKSTSTSVQDYMLYLQTIIGLQFIAISFASQALGLDLTSNMMLTVCFSSLIASILLCVFLFTVRWYPGTRCSQAADLILSIAGFWVSLSWIYLIATSAVSLLTTLGFILQIPTPVLGATIFAIGNSSNDLVADIAVARRGFPIMAASACLGGPMMNMLLGIGGGGLLQLLKEKKVEEGYTFLMSRGVFISAACLLAGLGVTLTYAFCNSWKLDRNLGFILLGIWTTFTVATVGTSLNEI